MKKNSGMTMVEVLMGFVILLLMIGMLSGIIVVASNMYRNAVDLKWAEEALQEKMYKENIADSAETVPVSLSLVPASDMPGEKTPVPVSATLYKLSSSEVLDQADAETLDVKVYFVK